jgi:hypothetical protein
LINLGVISPSLENLAKFYNNLEKVNDRAALLSCICCLSDLGGFKKAGFMFSSNSTFDNAHRKNKRGEFIPSYCDVKTISYHENQFLEKKKYFCQTLRWALSEPNYFQHSNIPLLKRGDFFLLFFFIYL